MGVDVGVVLGVGVALALGRIGVVFLAREERARECKPINGNPRASEFVNGAGV